ncbi:MAG: AAA family ATPase [Bacilli bacterium]
MLIKTIKLTNYRQFKDTYIEFSCDPEKKFTVILGDNTFGKTTFVRAFLWCLYQLNDYSDKILLNSDVASDMRPDSEAECRVKIELEHNNCSYIIDTVEKYKKSSSGTVVVSVKATTSIQKSTNIFEGYYPVPSRLVREEIESILGNDLKNYFFYDGENNKIEAITKTGKLKDAVSNLLGLQQIEALENFYNPRSREGVYSFFTNKMVSINDDLSNSTRDKYDEKINERERIIAEISSNNNEIDTLQNQLEEKEEFLDANQEIKEDQEKKQSLDRKIREEKHEKENLFASLLSSFASNETLLKILFAKSFEKYNLENKLKNSSFTAENSLSNISETAVDELINRGYCLCGTRIENGSEAYHHLIESKEHMQPRNFGRYAQDFIDGENQNICYAKSNLENLTTLADRLLTVIEDIDRTQDELTQVKRRIEGTVDIGKVQEDINNISVQISVKELRNREISNRLPGLEREIDTLQNRLDSIASRNAVNDMYRLCNDYVSKIYELSSRKLTKMKAEIRASLESETDQIFQSMYHGNRKIVIDENFRASTLVVGAQNEKRKLDTSTGLETVKNFAFVAGLMKLVKDRLNSSGDDLDDNESIDESYPLVMDAPFSSTDPTHIKNICVNLPNYCNQIILVVMKKDFDNALVSIQDKIGKLYHINKHNETYTTIEEGEVNVR